MKEFNKEAKNERLEDAYLKLLKIIKNLPDEAPVDILNTIEYPPNYSHENYTAVINTLQYQIDDYIKDESKNYIEIASRRECLKELEENKKSYFGAKDMYESFKTNEKANIDLYAGASVKNIIVELEVLINNAFISGRTGFKDETGRNMKIELCNKLIDEMRKDIGIDFN